MQPSTILLQALTNMNFSWESHLHPEGSKRRFKCHSLDSRRFRLELDDDNENYIGAGLQAELEVAVPLRKRLRFVRSTLGRDSD